MSHADAVRRPVAEQSKSHDCNEPTLRDLTEDGWDRRRMGGTVRATWRNPVALPRKRRQPLVR